MKNRPTAQELNDHLSNGGLVQVTTYLKSTIYKQKHSGMFREKSGNLEVQHGKTFNCLSMGTRMLVKIKLGRFV